MTQHSLVWRAYFLIFLISRVHSWSLNKILMTGPKFGILTENTTLLMSLSSSHKGYGLFMDSIGRGAQRATQECQYQFQWERWNCDITSAQLMQSEQPRGRRKKLITLSQTRTKIYTENRRFSRLYQNTFIFWFSR